MKVVFIYRMLRQGAFSIEELFHAVANELRNHIEVIEYKAGTRIEALSDVYNLRKMKADIYHLTGDVNYLVPLLPKGKTVLTIHDIGHYLFGLRGFKRWLYKCLWLYWPIRTARTVTTISAETYRNILNYFKVSKEKLLIIENCHSSIFKSTVHPFNTQYPRILQVGTKSYKNVPRLVKALQGIQCKLVLIGKLDTETIQNLEECKVDYLNLVNLTQEEIYQQYVVCDIVSFISIGEGFGVPIIEAQAMGRPLISSNIPPLCEVAGNGACLVNPLEVSEIREGLLKIITNSDYRIALAEQGLCNSQRFSPAIISNQYLNLYKKLTAHD